MSQAGYIGNVRAAADGRHDLVGGDRDRSVGGFTGHLTGSARETEEATRFAVTSGVRPMIERMPPRRAGEAVTARSPASGVCDADIGTAAATGTGTEGHI